MNRAEPKPEAASVALWRKRLGGAAGTGVSPLEWGILEGESPVNLGGHVVYLPCPQESFSLGMLN